MNTLKLIYLNLSFFLLFLLFSAIYIPVAIFVVFFLSLFSSKRSSMRRFHFAIAWYGLVIVSVLPFPLVRIQYKDYFKDTVFGPYIFVCNHRSFSDAFLVSRPCISSEAIQVGNTWPFRIPVIGFLARLAGFLNISEMPFEQFSKRAGELLDKGISIVAFPEGTRSGDNKMNQFYSSIFRVALETRRPIVPICISGNEHIPHRGTLLLRPGLIKIHKMPALQWNDFKHMNAYLLKNKIRNIIAIELNVIEGV